MADSILALSEIRSVLAETRDLADILAIRDKAEFLRQMLKAKGESLAAQNEMAEVTALAEIKIGKALAGMEKRKNRHSSACSLQELGIEQTAAHRWQTMAAAEKQVGKLVKQATEQGKDFTRAMVYREGKRIKHGDAPPRDTKESWGPGEWISHLRKRVESIYDEAPEDFRGIMANVLRTLADNVEQWESSDDGSGRGSRDEVAVA